MKNKILLEVIIVLSVVYYFIGSNQNDTSFFVPPSTEVRVKDTSTSQINTYPVEEYVLGVVAGEMPASFEEEALKAQAIAARTFAYYKLATSGENYDLTNDTTSQVHITKEQMQEYWGDNFDIYYAKIKKAVSDTKDMVMTYNNEVISAYYYSMSNGYTENAEAVFGTGKDYLKSVESKADMQNKDFEVTKIMSQEEFCQKLNVDCSAGIIISDIQRSNTGRVNTIIINNQSFVGTQVRSLLDLRSTDFEINVDNDVNIKTKGFGHGVGMSQYGAQYMAQDNKTYDEILKHYYTGITIDNINKYIKV